MLKTAYYVESTSINPYENLAREESLFEHHQPQTVILYLWQNHHTVVIGKNQNAYQECDLPQMERDHCYLARRSTGGGAVYHDLGNLNFTFIADEDDYDLNKQTQTIISALAVFGITAEQSGRNDIEVDGKKISGNAFLHKDGKKLQHGTLLVNTDKQALGKYLRLSPAKRQHKGVASVQSRVENISAFNPSVTIDRLKEVLRRTFELNYGLQLQPFSGYYPLEDLLEKYYSYHFRYNRIPDHTLTFQQRLSFGEIEVYAQIINDCLMELEIYTDAIPLAFIERLKKNLAMTCLQEQAFRQRLEEFPPEDEQYHPDILRLLTLIKEKYYAL